MEANGSRTAPEGERCRLCRSTNRVITEEHVPPKSAGNRGAFVGRTLRLEEGGFRTFSGAEGVSLRVLCERCNSRYGSSLGTTFGDFAKAVIGSGRLLTRDGRLFVSTQEIFPARVVRHLLLNHLCLLGDGEGPAPEDVRDFVRSRDPSPPPGLPNVSLYYNQSETFRVVPIAGVGSLLRRPRIGPWIGGEIAAPGLGAVFTYSGRDAIPAITGTDLLDVSGWTSAGWKERVSLQLELPPTAIREPRPLGFGTPAEIEKRWSTHSIVWLAVRGGPLDSSAAFWRRTKRRPA
ncbi:hypothetical protein V3331_01920 [Gaopeijia maritima]|uniref:hypothetical protein n=1 Tax=Gaopeijia maritima TaxID=3119007 RepID=UPI00324914D7